MMELISRTRNGMITYCAHCKVYHLEFGNLFFRLSEAGFECLRNYIVSINGPYCERSNRKMNANRKIFLKLPAQNVYFCVCTAELEELKSLVLLQSPAVEETDGLIPFMHDISLNYSACLSVFRIDKYLNRAWRILTNIITSTSTN